MSTNQILVTAATGNVGTPLVKALKRKDNPFVAATRHAENAIRQLGSSVNTVYLDYEEPGSFGEAMSGNDLLFLCGPSATPNAGELIMPMVEEAKKHNIRHIVFIASHPKVAEAIKESGIPYTFISANFFMQNFELYQTEEIRDRNRLFLPCGKGKAPFIHTRDIGEVAAEILANPDSYQSETVKITGPRAISLFEAASVFSEALGEDITYENPNEEAYRKDRKERGYPDDYINAMISVFGKIKSGDSAEPSSGVQKILGRQPLPLHVYAEENRSLFQ